MRSQGSRDDGVVEFHLGDIPPRTSLDFGISIGPGGVHAMSPIYRCLDCEFATKLVEEIFYHQSNVKGWHRIRSRLMTLFGLESFFINYLGLGMVVAAMAADVLARADWWVYPILGFALGVNLWSWQSRRTSLRKLREIRRRRFSRAAGLVQL